MTDTLPLKIHYVPFVRYTKHESPIAVDEPKKKSTKQQKNIIIGGYSSNKGGFHELIVNDHPKSINYKSFENDYNKKFANIKHIGAWSARYTHSFLIRNNKYLIVFSYNDCYNVYDMCNDKWLLKQGEKGLTKNNSFESRSVLIKDMIIISTGEKLYFYHIGNDHIRHPKLFHEYKLRNYKNVSFNGHGMCLMDFEEESSQYGSNLQYRFKIILFGGTSNKDALSSFLELDVKFVFFSRLNGADMSISERLINKTENEVVNNMNNNSNLKQEEYVV